MPSLSSRSLGEALCRACPCFPRILLADDFLVVRSAVETAVASSVPGAHGDGDVCGRGLKTNAVITPILCRPCYSCVGGAGPVLTEFTERHGYRSPVFVLCHSALLHASNGVLGTTPLVPSLSGDVDEVGSGISSSVASAGAAFQVPSVSTRLLRCQSRMNLTSLPRTRRLQEELRRTEGELRRLYKLACSCDSVSSAEFTPLAVVSSPLAGAASSPPSPPLQLCWQKQGWFLEDAALAVEESKTVPRPSRTLCYWSAWVTPYLDSFCSRFVLRLQDMHHFLLEDHLTLINVEAVPHHLANGNKIIFPVRRLRSAADYWASTGDPVRVSGTHVQTAGLADARLSEHTCFSFRNTCWFAADELPERRLQVRRAGEVVQLPEAYDCCGFFLHEAPWWFLMPSGAVMQRCPFSVATLRGISSATGCGSHDEVLAALQGSGPLRGEIVFVLQEAATWRVYPRSHGVMNFHQRLPNADALPRCGDSSPVTAPPPLIFIDINEAVRLMRGWSLLQQQQQQQRPEGNRRGPGLEKERQFEGQERIITFFAALPSPISAAAFINTFILHCARALDDARTPLDPTSAWRDSMTEIPPAETPTKATVGAQHGPDVGPQCHLRPESTALSGETARDDQSGDTDGWHAADEDFPAVDRRVYTPGHRLNKAYTHPRDEHSRSKHTDLLTNLKPAVAEGIIAARRKNKGHNCSSSAAQEFPCTEQLDGDKGTAVVRDLGIVWLSFSFTVPAVSAFDTEIMHD
ncbi:uncharacterized protein Tco025E_01585 [Trypanosoma conorhini]|uniref:Uncharacterized protein n=1 Tax=Trypanosoma conorhini TaxID=83891 RepID=A0A3R7LDD8_9TRYP|nr:uncharacterized protein Tco025E_01585 [Trypanosoma conorhini]RNF26140.1 hypothetical protein Tco025E_01585 [Trypanosoma conorhini]